MLDALTLELQLQGYRVIEFAPNPAPTEKEPGPPKPVTAEMVLALKPDQVAADAVLALVPFAGYWAPGPLNAYTRYVTLQVSLAETGSGALLFDHGYKYLQPFSDPYSYNTYEGMSKDLGRAFGGLRRALMDLVPQVSRDLRRPAG